MNGSAWYDELRDRYRPEQVKLLLVAESPPDPRSRERRFFYSPSLKYDNLYRAVAIVLYGDEDGFDLRAKPEYLGRMRDDGVWLIDAVDTPVNGLPRVERLRKVKEAAPQLAARCQKLDPSVGVLVCHSVVYRAVAETLRSNQVRLLHDRPLPFPLGNTRRQFVDGARGALSGAGWRD